MTSHKINGVRTQVDGQTALRFERLLTYPVQTVWQSITDPVQQREWLGFGLQDVLEHDPPKLFTVRWGESVLRWELAAEGRDGAHTWLVLTHVLGSELERRDPAREAAEWELHLEQLAGALDGVDVAWSLDRWVQLKQAYVRAFPEPGRVRMVGDTPRVTFDRWLEQPPERIWAALTDNEQLRQWFAATVEGSWEPGSRDHAALPGRRVRASGWPGHQGRTRAAAGVPVGCRAAAVRDLGLRGQLPAVVRERPRTGNRTIAGEGQPLCLARRPGPARRAAGGQPGVPGTNVRRRRGGSTPLRNGW